MLLPDHGSTPVPHISAPNIIVNVRNVWLYECAVRAMRKKLKLISDGGNFGSKKCKRGYGGAYGGVWRSLGLVGVWSLESGDRFYVGMFGRNLASVAVKIFSHLIYFIQKFLYIHCDFQRWLTN
jgi:hypothetical protein